jgi:hypothetical protein
VIKEVCDSGRGFNVAVPVCDSSSATAVDVLKSPSKKTQEFVNKHLVDVYFPRGLRYSHTDLGKDKYYVKSNLKKEFPELKDESYVDESTLRRLVEKHAPKLPSIDPKSHQSKLQSVEARIAKLEKAIQNPSEQKILKEFNLTLSGGTMINAAEIAFPPALCALVLGIELAILINPLIALVLLVPVLLGVAVYLAPTDAKRLKAAQAEKEKLVKDMQEAVRFYQGKLSADLIKDFRKDLDALALKIKTEPGPSGYLVTKQRIEDRKEYEQLEKVIEELESMVKFFKEKKEPEMASAKICPMADVVRSEFESEF